jgi:hypothetical protein
MPVLRAWIAIMLLLPHPARAASLRLCVDDPVAARPAAEHLQHWLTQQLSLGAQGRCDETTGDRGRLIRPTGYRGRFVRAADRVVFVLVPPTGSVLRRDLPWLARPDAALQRLAAAGRLSEFSLVVRGLIAEHRLAQRTGPVATPPAQPPAPRAPAPRAGSAIRRAARARPWTPPLPEADLDLAGRWRSSALLSAEMALSLSWYGVFARVGYQPGSEWTLDGRPVRVQTLPLALGWRPVVWRTGRWRLATLGALRLERSWLRRLDLERASTHGRWDLGAALGLVLTRGLGAGWRTGLRLEASWFPGGSRVTIPEGPSAGLSTIGLQLALGLGWGGAR